ERTYKNLAVKKMVHLYQGADDLLIISGDYTWLFDNDWSATVRAIILRKLPYHVKMVSYKSPDEVTDSWSRDPDTKKCTRLFSAIAFPPTACEHKGKVVKINNSATYIHLYRHVARASRRESVCVFYGDREARALVSFVEDELGRLYEGGLKDVENEKKK